MSQSDLKPVFPVLAECACALLEITDSIHAHGTFGTLVKFTTADASFSKDVFDKAVKSALGRVNTHGISNLTQHQSKALLNFLCGKDSFVYLPTGHGKSLIYQLEQKITIGVKFNFWFEWESMRRATRMCTLTLIFMVKWHLSWSTARKANSKRNNYLPTGGR